MSEGLRAAAARKAGSVPPEVASAPPVAAGSPPPEGAGEAPRAATERLEPAGGPELPATTSEDPPTIAVHTALARAIRDLGHVGKRGQFRSQNAGNYNYRGVDQVVNAANAVFERHGLTFAPEVLSFELKDRGKIELGYVRTRWHLVGPAGDVYPAPITTLGQAMDTSDKVLGKAQSVAMRIFLVQVLQMTTGDPDPDEVRIERGDSSYDPLAYRDEALNPRTSVSRLSQMLHDLQSLGKGTELVTNEIGEDEKVGSLIVRVRRERAAGS